MKHNQSAAERQFVRRLAKAGWYTYRDEETGRVVTNAHEHELATIQQISGVQCEILSPPLVVGSCARIGPTLPASPPATS